MLPKLHTHTDIHNVKTEGKGKVHPTTGHEGPEGEYMYNSTLSLTSALYGVVGQRHALAALPTGKILYPLYRRLRGTQDRSGRVRKNSPPPGFEPRTFALPTQLSGLTT
jgi:hypothetical protein